jgi:hypothetical protein
VRHRKGLEVVAAVPPLLADFKAPFGTDPDHRNHSVGIAVRLDPGGPSCQLHCTELNGTQYLSDIRRRKDRTSAGSGWMFVAQA